MTYTGKPTRVDFEVARGLVNSGRPLCQDDYEYCSWVLASACKLCKNDLAELPDGVCNACYAAIELNHSQPFDVEQLKPCDWCGMKPRKPGRFTCSDECDKERAAEPPPF